MKKQPKKRLAEAKALQHHKPKVVPDKRTKKEKARAKRELKAGLSILRGIIDGTI